jgi:hypothetical protein
MGFDGETGRAKIRRALRNIREIALVFLLDP